MINAKTEFLQAVGDYKVIGAKIDIQESSESSFVLKLNYTNNDWNNFLDFLDQEYDSGFGTQTLYGIIFCDDGIWLTREEYDGSEWWVIHNYPDLTEHFDTKDVIIYNRNKKLKILDEIIDLNY